MVVAQKMAQNARTYDFLPASLFLFALLDLMTKPR
jgi:hypothetical protein